MARDVGTEPPGRLIELALAGHRPAGRFRVVVRDSDVHEPLEEVALGRLGGAPGVLERLVRGEPLAFGEQLEPVLVRVTHGEGDGTPW